MADLFSSITSANSECYIIVPEIYPQGIRMINYAVDEMYNIEKTESTEVRFGADGHLNTGVIYNTVPLTITLSPSSPSVKNILNWRAAENVAISRFRCNAKITIPSLKTEFDFVDGVILSAPLSISAGRTLKDYQVEFSFRTCIISKI